MSELELEHLKAKGLAEIHSHYDARRAESNAYYDKRVAETNHELAIMDRLVLVIAIIIVAGIFLLANP